MQLQKLREAIEHMDRAKELLKSREIQESKLDNDVHAAIMSLSFYKKVLTEDLYIEERKALAEWNTKSAP